MAVSSNNVAISAIVAFHPELLIEKKLMPRGKTSAAFEFYLIKFVALTIVL